MLLQTKLGIVGLLALMSGVRTSKGDGDVPTNTSLPTTLPTTTLLPTTTTPAKPVTTATEASPETTTNNTDATTPPITPTPTTIVGEAITTAATLPPTTPSTTSTTPTTTPEAANEGNGGGGDGGDGGGGSSSSSSSSASISQYGAMWAGLCIDASTADTEHQYSLDYSQCASLCADESAKATADAAAPGCTGFAHHGRAGMCLSYPTEKGALSTFTTNGDCEEDGCGMTYTGWRCYGVPGTGHSGPPGKYCPASDASRRAAAAASDAPRQSIWSPTTKDCITVPDNGVDCYAEGLSWWLEESMCVTACPEGQFANPGNGACIAVSGVAVCGEGTEYKSGECVATELATAAPEQTTQHLVATTFCGEGTAYDAEADECVTSVESLLASSATATIAVGQYTLPLWGLISVAALLFLVFLTTIVGCCCCCGCCECSSAGSGGDEGYRKYLPDSYTNPAWRQSYQGSDA